MLMNSPSRRLIHVSLAASYMKSVNHFNSDTTKSLLMVSPSLDATSHSLWASLIDVARFPSSVEDMDDDDWDLVRSPTPTKQDIEPEIWDMLAEGSTNVSMNEDGQTALHLAVIRNASSTRYVLGHGFDVDTRNLDGETALMCAVNAGNTETVALLLHHDADVNVVDDWYGTCLHIAASKDLTGSITRLLLERNPNTELVDGLGLTPLFVAAFNANDVITHQLLEKGAKHHAREPGSFSALHYAAMLPNHTFMSRLIHPRGPDFEAFYNLSTYHLTPDPSKDTTSQQRALTISTLLKHGVDIHAASKGFTPLHIAALTAQASLVDALLSNGASAQGIPVINAYWGLSPATVHLLLSHGADIEATDSRYNKTALIWTAEIGSPATLDVLLQHGANVHDQDIQGSSALHYAAANGRVEIVQRLLSSGADANLRDSEGRTPLIRLASAGSFYLAGRWWDPTLTERENTAVLLLEAGCDPGVRDVHGKAVARYAVGNGYVGILKVIGDWGGNLEMVDGDGKTPLDRAREKGLVDVIRFLQRRKVRGRT